MPAGHMLGVVPFSARPNLKTKCSISIPTTNQNLIEKIRGTITNGKVELSPSAYDTAWVAMVPSKEYSGNKQSCFPQCLGWILENQNSDGSWGLDHSHLVQDSLSGTLACILALHRWDVGHQQVQRGLDFIASNGWAATRNDQFSPIGFNVIFPWMVAYAKEVDLTLPLSPSLVDSLLQLRDSEIRRKRNLEYLAEGLGNSCNWKELITTHQRRNGSLFNSPATTAAALIHSHDDKCYEYLTLVHKACNRCVPTIYPVDTYARLAMVDALERLGVKRYFEKELSNILDEVYRRWQEKEEEIFHDITCRAMAFRLLRMNGYEVASEELAEFVDREHFFNMVSIRYKGVSTVLELYRASQVRVNEKEGTLEKIHAWTSSYLKQKLLNQSILDKQLQRQVEYDLKNFHGTLDRVGNKRSIELYDAQGFQILKTAYRCSTFHNQDFITFSLQDFRSSQAQYQKEFQQLERWHTDCRLDGLTQGRKVLRTCYSLTAAVIVDPELSMARISLVQAAVLVACLDDLLDLYGSREESLCIMKLVSEWKPATTYYSKEVEIIFTAIYDTVNEIAANASALQDRCVKHDLISLWVDHLTASLQSMDSNLSDNDIPTLSEYLSSAWKSIGFGPTVLSSIYFLGTKLSIDMFKSREFTSLCYHTCMVCRLLNDLSSFKREQEEGTLNSVSLLTVERGVSEEEAISQVRQMAEYHRRRVVKIVCERNGSVIPRECKDHIWKSCKIGNYIYPHDGGDELSSPQETIKDLNAVVWEPLELNFQT